MTIALTHIIPRSERRVRLTFNSDLDSGAFDTSLYTVVSQDSLGASPSVVAVLPVAGTPSAVELVLSTDLVGGGLYWIYAEGVPAADLSVTPDGSFEPMRQGNDTRPRADVEPIVRNRELLLYGVDIVWDGTDFQRSATGDLNRVQGSATVAKNLNRGISANGLPYDPTWGAHAREYVDSPQGSVGTLKGSVETQVLRDPRVQTVKVTFEIVGTDTILHVVPKLVSGELMQRVSLTVPNDV